MPSTLMALAEAEQQIISDIRSTLRKLASLRLIAGSIESENLARLTDKAFRQEFPVDEADNCLAAAIARGIPARQQLVEAEGGSLSAEAAARELGISKPAILKCYQKGQILAWREERQKAVRFPVWQFENQRMLDGIQETLQILSTRSQLDDFGRMLFFLSNRAFLGGKRPLDLLREANKNQVLLAAQGYGD